MSVCAQAKNRRKAHKVARVGKFNNGHRTSATSAAAMLMAPVKTAKMGHRAK